MATVLLLSLVLYISAPFIPLKPKVINNEKCLADELQEALVKNEHHIDSDNDDVFLPNSGKQLPKVYPKYSCKYLEELKTLKFNSVSKNSRALLNSDNMYLKEDSADQTDEHRTAHEKSQDASRDKSNEVCTASSGQGNNEGNEGNA